MLLQTIVLINTALKTLLEQMLRFERHATRSGLELTYSVMVGGGGLWPFELSLLSDSRK